MIIYKVINTINRKVYIGATIQPLEQRKKEHLSRAKQGSKFTFHVAIRKYGFDNFVWEVLEHCNSVVEMNKREIYYISLYGTYNKKGYNMTKGGDGRRGPLSEKAKEKLRGNKNFLGKTHTLEVRKRLSEVNKGNKHALGRVVSEETKRKISNSEKGKIVSQESKLKMSKSKSYSLPVEEIVEKNKLGQSMKILAIEYNVSYTAIRNRIKHPEKYKSYEV